MKWLVFYADRTRYVASVAGWKRLPPGVQGVIEFEDELTPAGVPYRRILHGTDWYCWVDGRVELGPGGMPDEWADPPPESCSSCIKKSGPNLPEDEWAALYAQMWETRWPT